MKYLKNRQEFLTGVIEYKESYQYKSQDLKSSTLVREVLENDITWGGSLLGRLINSTIRKAVIGAKVFRINPLIKKLRAQLESLEGDYLTKEKGLAQQAIIYALFEAIKKASMKPEPIDNFLKDGGLIDQLVKELDEVEDFPKKEELKKQIEQFRKDLEELKRSGDVEVTEEEEEEEEEEVGDPKEKFRTSVIKVLESVISIHITINKDKPVSTEAEKITPEEEKFEIGGIYTYTNSKKEKRKVKLVSFTNQILIGPDKQFITTDDVKKTKLDKPSSVFVEFLDDSGKSISNKPAMAVDISTLSIESGVDHTGRGKMTKNTVTTNQTNQDQNTTESLLLESIEDPKAKAAYENILKYDESSKIATYIKIIQSMIDSSKEDQKVGFEWAGVIWPTEGTIYGKITYFGKQLLGNLTTVGKPLVEVTQFNDVAKSVSLFCRPILGLKSSPEALKSMEGISESIQSIIDSFDVMSENLPKISEKKEEKPAEEVKQERLMSSYQKFIRMNEADETEEGEDKENENLIFKAYRKNFSEEDEEIWIATKEKKSEMDSKFKNIKINIDTNDRVDPIVRIANIFGDAYKLFSTPQIPSGRPNGRISQKTWREYKYLGKGTGDWTPDRGPNGPFAVKALFNKWEKGVMSLIEDQSLRKIFANPNLSINGNPGAGQTLFTFMNDMLEDDALKDYDGARRKLLLKYFNIAEDKAKIDPATSTTNGKTIAKDDVGDPGQTRLVQSTPFNIRRPDTSDYDHSYLLINYESVGKKEKGLMLMYILGSFTNNENKKVLAFKYQLDSKDLFKYLGTEELKEPQDDAGKSLKTGGEINIGFVEDFPMATNLSFKGQDLTEFINNKDLKDNKFKVLKAFTLNVARKDKSGKDIMRMVSIEKDIDTKFRPKNDQSIGLSKVKEKYNK